MESHGTPSSGQPATRILNAPAELGRGVVLSNRYEVERVLGQGGMGVVVAAQDRETGRRVALKFLQLDAARDPGTHARFLREAQAASAIACEHVVRVFDAGTMGSGAPFIVMELLEGEDLAQAIERGGPLPVHDAVDHVLEALVAIGLAHLRGIVHRDLKPANLFLTRSPDGRPVVKVLDFGLSKDAAGREGLNLTKTSHAAIGTPLYMAPEQIRSLKSASFASDLWAMGVILFELTTKQLPFDGDSLGALFSSIAADPARRLDAVLPGAPPPLVEAVDRCLRKKPDQRPPDALTLATMLVPMATPRGRTAFERLQREHAAATGGWNLAGGAIVDEPSGARAAAPVERARLAATFLDTAPPHASRLPELGTSQPTTLRMGSTGGKLALLLALSTVVAAGVGGAAWWLVSRSADTPSPARPLETPAPAAVAPIAPTILPVEPAPSEVAEAPTAPSTDVAPSASAEVAPPPSAALAATPRGPLRSPRPTETTSPGPPPPGTGTPSTSLEDVMKRGRR
jgi:predicted Ser/Thr protein kinase